MPRQRMIGNNRHSDRTFVSEHTPFFLPRTVTACLYSSLSHSPSPSFVFSPSHFSLSHFLSLSTVFHCSSTRLSFSSPIVISVIHKGWRNVSSLFSLTLSLFLFFLLSRYSTLYGANVSIFAFLWILSPTHTFDSFDSLPPFLSFAHALVLSLSFPFSLSISPFLCGYRHSSMFVRISNQARSLYDTFCV